MSKRNLNRKQRRLPGSLYLGLVLVTFWFTPLAAQAGRAQEALLSSAYHLIENTTQTVRIGWQVEPETRTQQLRGLVFAHGPVEAASAEVAAFSWQRKAATGVVAAGSEIDFASQTAAHLKPTLSVDSLGMWNGQRVMEINLRLGIREGSGDWLVFPKGEVLIRFTQTDPHPAQSLATDFEPIAESLFINQALSSPVSRPTPAETPPYLEGDALRIETREAGFYALPAPMLLSMAPGTAVEDWALFRERQPAAFAVIDGQGKRKRSGALQPADRVIFHASESQSAYSPRVMTWAAPVRDAHQQYEELPRVDDAEAPAAMTLTGVLEQNRFFIPDSPKTDEQNRYWMWAHLVRSGSMQTALPLDEIRPGAQLELEAHFATGPPYTPFATDDIELRVAGRIIGTAVAEVNRNRFTARTLEPITLEQEGPRPISLHLKTAQDFERSNRYVHLDRIVWRLRQSVQPSPFAYEAPEDNAIAAIPPQAQWAFFLPPQQAAPPAMLAAGESMSAVSVPQPGRLFVLRDEHIQQPASVERWTPQAGSDAALRSNAPSDMIIIAPRAWLPTLEPYQEQLGREGIAARLISVEAIYNRFGDGRLSPHAIRRFLRHAWFHWQTPRPGYVLLVGDATWDYWNRFGADVVNYVPAYRGEPDYAVENWFVQLDDAEDPIGEMMIGRWPVQSQDALESLVQKSLRYRQLANPLDPAWNRVYLLTDHGFDTYMEEVDHQWTPPGFRKIRRHIQDFPLVDNIYLPPAMREQLRAKTSPQATQETIDILNRGVFLWKFYGHGAPNVIGNERIFFGGGSKFSDVPKLNHPDMPFILWAFSCETCTFDYPREKWNFSVGEDLLTHDQGGSVALLGASGRGFPNDHLLLARGLHYAAFELGLPRLGQHMMASDLLGMAQQSFFEPKNQFILLGDPTLSFPRFERLAGEVVDQGGSAAFSFEAPNPLPQERIQATWLQQSQDVVERRASERLAGEISKADLPTDATYWAGAEVIAKQNGRIHVWHGAEPLPRVPAPPVIPPTTGRLPDLTFAEAPGISPPYPRDGQTIFFETRVVNQGQATAESIRVRGYVLGEKNSEKPMNVVVGSPSVLIERLDPGDSQPVRVRWDPSANAGNHRFLLRIDPADSVAEADEENNQASGTVSVLRKADLAIAPSDLMLEETGNGGYRFGFQFHNQGESTAKDVLVQLRAYLAGQEEPAEMELPQTFVARPDETVQAVGIGLPPQLEAIEVILDPDEIQDERILANNAARLQAP